MVSYLMTERRQQHIPRARTFTQWPCFLLTRSQPLCGTNSGSTCLPLLITCTRNSLGHLGFCKWLKQAAVRITYLVANPSKIRINILHIVFQIRSYALKMYCLIREPHSPRFLTIFF